MDSISDTTIGSTAAVGSPELPSIVQGQTGNAMHFDGENDCMSFGDQRANCFANPMECSEGITIAFWLYRYENDGYTTVYDSGGYLNERRVL